MWCCVALTLLVLLQATCDINYLLRTLFTVLTSLLEPRRRLGDVTCIYGMGTLGDCDVSLRRVRSARLLRELDMARYHHYLTTGVYRRSRQLGLHSLQGSTLALTLDPVPLFVPYKITTKLVHWDEKSLFLEHTVVTLHDARPRCLLVSRQHALGPQGQDARALLHGLPGADTEPACPQYITHWLDSMEVTSKKLRLPS